MGGGGWFVTAAAAVLPQYQAAGNALLYPCCLRLPECSPVTVMLLLLVLLPWSEAASLALVTHHVSLPGSNSTCKPWHLHTSAASVSPWRMSHISSFHVTLICICKPTFVTFVALQALLHTSGMVVFEACACGEVLLYSGSAGVGLR